MGAAGRLYCHRFSMETMVEKLDHLYEKLIFAPQKAVQPKADAPTLREEEWLHTVSSTATDIPMRRKSTAPRSSTEAHKASTK